MDEAVGERPLLAKQERMANDYGREFWKVFDKPSAEPNLFGLCRNEKKCINYERFRPAAVPQDRPVISKDAAEFSLCGVFFSS